MSNVVKLKSSAVRMIPNCRKQMSEPFPSLDTVILEEEPIVNVPEFDLDSNEENDETVMQQSEQPAWQDMSVVIAQAQKESYDRGYAQALKDCEEQYHKKLQEECKHLMAPMVQEIDQILTAIHGAWIQFSSDVENVVVTLSLAAAERVIKQAVQHDDKIILNQIREGLKRISGVDHLKIRLHPDDEKIVRESRTALLINTDAVRDIVVEPDESISRGGCILESDSGSIDVTVETQTTKMAELLTEARALFK